MSSIPDLYDPWGPLARENIRMISGGNTPQYPPYWSRVETVLYIPQSVALISHLTGSYVVVSAGSWAVGSHGALVVTIPPGAANGDVVVPQVVAWTAVKKQFLHRDMVILGYCDGNSDQQWNWVIPPFSDKWHGIGAAGEPAFANGWVNYNSVLYETVAFRRDQDGMVFLKGLLLSPLSATNGSPIFTLPAGYRPDKLVLRYMVMGNGDPSRVDIDSTGAVINQSAANVNTYSCLGDLGMPFPAVH